MKDHKLEQRKEAFQKNNINILEKRQEHKLTLRKLKIDDMIMKMREKVMEKYEEKSKLEINPDTLVLPSEILNKKFEDFDGFVSFIRFLLSSNDINYIKFGILHLRKQITLEVNPPIIEVVQNGFLEALLNLLDQYVYHDTIVYEILWCFINILYNMDEKNDIYGYFITPKAFRVFLRILTSGKQELIQSVIWVITHVAYNEIAREAILGSPIFLKIVELLEQDNVSVLVIRHGIWLLSTISKGFGGEMKNAELVKLNLTFQFERILKILVFYFRMDSPDVIGDILFGLSNFSNTKWTFTLKILIDRGVVTHIMKYDVSTEGGLLQSALRITGNLLTGDDMMIDEMINYGVIQFLERLMKHSSSQVRKEAVWCLSNIACGTKSQITALVESGVLEKVFEMVQDSQVQVVREVVWVLSNCISGSDLDLCAKLTNRGIIRPFIFLLVHLSEPTILGICLEGLQQLFQQGESISMLGSASNPFVDHFIKESGIEYLEKLQQHPNNEIYNYTVNLLAYYFNTQSNN